MALRFFVVPVYNQDESQRELNAFLSGHRIVSVDKRFVDLGADSYWAVCVDYIDANAATHRAVGRIKGKIDYKEVLSPREFAVFCKLRELRKEIAQAEAVPVYTIFTNEQLAQIVQRRCRTKSDLADIDGLGEARLDRYADRILPLLIELQDGDGKTSGEPF